MNQHSHVLERYSAGASQVAPDLCCPVRYDPTLLEALPREIVEKDYGCGDPSRYVRPGDVVLDLGSGGGKICYMAAQLVGPGGHVLGVDMNDDMLALARRYEAQMAERLGGKRVTFHKGHIQDLALSLDRVDAWLREHPVRDSRDLVALEAYQATLRRDEPMIADASVDLVISNCVLNLVAEADRSRLVTEIARVLRPGGRVAISDIVCDEPVPEALRQDPELWSGCLSGAFQEQALAGAFARAGLVGIAYDQWEERPWRVVEGIEFRSVTLTAVRPSPKPCLDIGQAVIYRGPYAEVRDDEGHVYPRGERMAVCERTYRLLLEGPYARDFIGLQPAEARTPRPWCAPPGTRRPASETKGGTHQGADSGPGGCC